MKGISLAFALEFYLATKYVISSWGALGCTSLTVPPERTTEFIVAATAGEDRDESILLFL